MAKKIKPAETQIGFTAGQEDVDALAKVCDLLCGSENGAVRFCLREVAYAISGRLTSGMHAVADGVSVATKPRNKHFRFQAVDQERVKAIVEKLGFSSDRDAIRFAIRFQAKRI